MRDRETTWVGPWLGLVVVVAQGGAVCLEEKSNTGVVVICSTHLSIRSHHGSVVRMREREGGREVERVGAQAQVQVLPHADLTLGAKEVSMLAPRVLHRLLLQARCLPLGL